MGKVKQAIVDVEEEVLDIDYPWQFDTAEKIYLNSKNV